MSTNSAQAFIDWLNEIENKFGWTDNQFATKAGISHSALSRARSGIPPKWDVCVALADAANIPREQVFRAAGLLKSSSKLSPIKELLIHWAEQMDDEDAADLAALVEAKVRRQAERAKNAIAKTKP